MAEINFEEFKSKRLKLDGIGDKPINIEFIPYPIEKELFNNIQDWQNVLANKNSDVEKTDRMREIVLDVIKHPKNKNDSIDEDEIGLVQSFSIMMALIRLISERVIVMNSQFVDEEQKKTIPKVENQ